MGLFDMFKSGPKDRWGKPITGPDAHLITEEYYRNLLEQIEDGCRKFGAHYIGNAQIRPGVNQLLQCAYPDFYRRAEKLVAEYQKSAGQRYTG